MKLRLLLIFALLPFILNSQNNYIEFPDSNVVWNYNYSLHCFQNGTGNENYSIEISGDTLINGLLYQKLNTPFIESFTTGTCHLPTTGYKGAIREDIQQKKVYYIPPSDTSEKLLYDFNMQVGDTLRGYTQEQFSAQYNTVISIDSILIGSQYHKRWLLNDCYNEYLIEGIGSTFGLLEQSNFCATDLPEFDLICFSLNGNSIYPSSANNCELITSITEKNLSGQQIKWYPNPVSSKLNLEMGAGFSAGQLKILVYDLQGKKLKEMEINTSDLEVGFELNDLEAGVYLFKLSNGKKLEIVQKIVVQ